MRVRVSEHDIMRSPSSIACTVHAKDKSISFMIANEIFTVKR